MFAFRSTTHAPLCGALQRMDAAAVLSGDAPVLAVRLTQLAGGGSILAVTGSHVVLGEPLVFDGTTWLA